MNEQYLMKPQDIFVARECGCSFMVKTGPKDLSMVSQAPMCCCGHPMTKEGYGSVTPLTDELLSNPEVMSDDPEYLERSGKTLIID